MPDFPTTPRGISPRPASLSRPRRPSAPEWRCGCGKLLGLFHEDRLHLRLMRSHEYFVTLPATCVCRGCGGLNEARARPSKDA